MTVTFKNTAAQGDVFLKRVSDIPTELVPTPIKNGVYVIAHSETGHHHVLPAIEGVEVYDQDEFVSYLKTDNVIELKHLRSFDTHETISVPPGIFRITRQREYTPEGYRRAAD